MTPRKGDRVLFVALWSSFAGMRGTVTATVPHVMVRIDNDAYDIRVGVKEIAVDEPSSVSMTGAE